MGSLPGDYVLKVGRTYAGLAQPLSWLIRNRREHDVAARYFRVPPSYHVRLLDSRGAPVNLILQKRLHGVPLSAVSAADLSVHGEELQQLAKACTHCWDEQGWLPDVIGGPPRLSMHDVRHSNNLFLDTSAHTVHLLDPSAFFCWFSRASVAGRVYASMLVRSARLLAARALSSAPRA